MKISEKHLDALQELINIGVGRGAKVLNTVLHSHIRLQVPVVKIVTLDELKEEMLRRGESRLSSVNLDFKGNCNGNAELIFPSESASRLVNLFSEEEEPESNLDSIRVGTLCEIGNIVLNALMGSISNLLSLRLSYTVPNYIEGSIEELAPSFRPSGDSVIFLAWTNFTIDVHEITGSFVLFLEVSSFDKLLSAIDALNEKAEAAIQ